MTSPSDCPEHVKALLHHTIANLPEGISERKQVLESLLIVLPSGAYLQEVRNLLFALNAHSLAQREFVLTLDQAQPSTTPPTHDGP